MFNHISVIKRNAHELVLTRSKLKAFFELSFIFAFFSFWYSALITDFSTFSAIKESFIARMEENKLFILFYLAPLMMYQRVYLCATTLFIGNRYVFNSRRKRFTHNSDDICRYDQIRNVQIRRIEDSDRNDSYRVSVIYSNQRKFFIAESTDRSYIHSLAADIADATETQIIYKN